MDWKPYLDDLKTDIRALNRTIPETTRAFSGLSRAVKDNGTLDPLTKELIALGIAVVQGCTPCIAWHVEMLVRLGGTREQAADALAMAIQMGGGPALMKAAEALACFDELTAAT